MACDALQFDKWYEASEELVASIFNPKNFCCFAVG